jgi:hypothetical protein
MFRFTVRDVLWFNVVIVLVIICWQHRDAYVWQQRARAAARALEGGKNCETEWRNDGIVVTTTVRNPYEKAITSIYYGAAGHKTVDRQYVPIPKPDSDALFR